MKERKRRGGFDWEGADQYLRSLGEDEFLAWRQAMLEETNRRTVGEILVTVRKKVEDINIPFVLVPWGDLHAGSGATRWKYIDQRIKTIIGTAGVYVVGVGDWIESVDPKHGVDSLQNSLPLYDQIEEIRRWVIYPLASKGRLLAMVRGHRAHEGALSKIVGDDAWRRMLTGYDIPLLVNGGVLDLVLENDDQGEKHLRTQCYHNTSGRSGKNPVRPLETRARIYSHGNVPDAIVAAHDHIGGAAVELETVLLRGGTPKGNIDNPDPYGISMGFEPTNPPGQGLLMFKDGKARDRDYEVVPYIDRNMGLAALSAMRLLESLEKQGITTEVIGEVREKDGPVKAKINKKKSKVSVTDHWMFDGEDREPQYEEVFWKVETSLPVGLFVLANVRYGSRSHDEEQTNWVESMLARKDMLWFAGRQLVDKKIPKTHAREYWVDTALELMSTGKGRNLGVLYDAVMKSSAWGRPIKEKGDIVSDPMMVVTNIVREMETVIVEHMGTVKIELGRDSHEVVYSATVLDNLENRGSTAFATGGLMSIYRDRLDNKPGVVMGGHMPGAGSAQIYDSQNPETNWPVMVAPGWMSKRANWKVGAVTESPADKLGPGVVLMAGGTGLFPGEYGVIPIGRESQWVLLDALTVLAAIRLGWADEEKLTSLK